MKMAKQKQGWICVECRKIVTNPKGSMKHPYCKKCFKKVWNNNYNKYGNWLVNHF